MLKERLLTMAAASALVAAAFGTSMLPEAGLAQQREIIVTQPELLAQATGQPGAEQQQPGAAQEGTAQEEEGTVKKPQAQADPSMFIGAQEETETVASALIGRTLYNDQAENIGDINDLVIGEDGTVKAVVIGVGGFLGIGEKNVAVRYDAIQATRQAESDQVLLVLNATADELAAAPEYETLAMKLAKQQAEKAAAESQSGAPKPLEQQQPAPSN